MSVWSDVPARRRVSEAVVLPLFATALFVSAFLLFAVQPMFAKMVLPALGGAPSVWSVAMVFFQAVLLAGYAYAHALNRLASPRMAVLVHLALLATVLVVALPIALSPRAATPPAEGAEILWTLGVFAASVGLPFFAVSANAPLLQAWFSRSGGAQASNPYVLYGASNLGSFAALIAYPLLIEPQLTLAAQSSTWSRGFLVLALLMAAAGVLGLRGVGSARMSASTAPAAPTTWRDRARWIALAFVPSAALVAVTAHITTDLAAAPFLWVLPLALFLLTFVIMFRDGAERLQQRLAGLLPIAVVLLLAIMGLGALLPLPLWASLALHLGVFFLVALVAHGALYAARPDASHLTEFYLWMSFGGVLGGIFAGLAAPHIFESVVEYPLLLVAALLTAGPLRGGSRVLARVALVLGAAILFAVLILTGTLRLSPIVLGALYLGSTAILLASLLARRDVMLIAGIVGAVLIARSSLLTTLDSAVSVRSFFGVHRVSETPDGRFRLLSHGTTVHGVERIRGEDGAPVIGPPRPIAYYGEGGPFHLAIEAVRAARGGRIGSAGLVGLGTGALACRSMPGERWRFYEIDADVVRIARDSGAFRSLTACGPTPEIVLGDARLTLAAGPDRAYDLLILDAFTSDAIPLHLLTREAFAVYLRRLASDGVILVHISNRHMDLAPEVARVANAHGLVTFLAERRGTRDMSGNDEYQAPTRLLAIARDPALLGDLPLQRTVRRVPVDPAVPVWTDDFSNILGPIWRHMRRTEH